MDDITFLTKWGIGEVYMLFALQNLFDQLKERYGIQSLVELKTSEAMQEFPERTWDMTTELSQLKAYDAVFIFRPFPHLIKPVVAHSSSFLILSSVNKRELGSHMQKLLQVKGEYYATQEELKQQAEALELEILECGYYDSPPWIDHSPHVLVPTGKIGITLAMIKRLLFFERLGTKFTSHHPYVLTRKKH